MAAVRSGGFGCRRGLFCQCFLLLLALLLLFLLQELAKAPHRLPVQLWVGLWAVTVFVLSSSGFLQPPERTMGSPSRFYSGRSHGIPWMSRVVDGVNPPTPLTLNRANETSASHHPY